MDYHQLYQCLEMRKFLIFFVIFSLFACKTQLVSKKELKNWNQNFQNLHYVAIKDIYTYEYDFQKQDFTKLDENPVFRTGTAVTFTVESGEDWVRLRAFDIRRRQTDYYGNIVLFIPYFESKSKNQEQIIKTAIDDFLSKNFKLQESRNR